MNSPLNSPLSCDDLLSRTADREQPVVPRSVHKDCIEHENLHKWIESQKAGFDLGEACVRDWVQRHWTGYLRGRWVEHLQGKVFWVELEQKDFGLLQREFIGQNALLNDILNLLKSGQENLHVICWAVKTGIPIEPVHEILKALDVNSLRLRHRFEAA